MTAKPTFLVLSDEHDRVAFRALEVLREGLPHSVELCTSQDLEQAAYFIEGRRDSQLSGEIVLRDGRIFCQDRIAGLWNRLTHWPTQLAGRKGGAPEALSAWLRGVSGSLVGFPGVRHPQRSHAWSRLHWSQAAFQAGLSAPHFRRQVGVHVNSLISEPRPGERLSILVAGDRISSRGLACGDLPQHVRQACVQLAKEVRGGLLEVRLIPRGSDGWDFADADQRPDPFSHGQAGMDGLMHLLYAPDPVGSTSAGFEGTG